MEKSSVRKVDLHLGGNGKKPHLKKGSVVAKRSAKKPLKEVPKKKAKKAKKVDLGGSHPACKPCRIKRLGSRKRHKREDKYFRRKKGAGPTGVILAERDGDGAEFVDLFGVEEFTTITRTRRMGFFSMVESGGGDSGLPDGVDRFDGD